MAALSKRERNLIGLALLGAAVSTGYVYVLEPLREQAQQTAELIPAREAQLQRRRLLIAQRASLATELAQIATRIEAQSERLLKGPTPPLAASEMQKLVKEVAAAANVEVRSERILPTADRDGLQEVPIEITVAGGIRESMNVLDQLERTSKLLTMQDLKVRVISAGQPRDLLTTITVAGYLLTPPTAKPGDKPAAPSGSAPAQGRRG
ncbi:MAG: type 4a pilus biogenesis protein PilO [Candidatus Rokubacteria bacterium]|nr:type 4a pilus biogenesis protein PilO [Candidatus Rokubacteria bacterium]